MEKFAIHYTDDDVDDLEMFKNAMEQSEAEVPLKTYNKADDFLRTIRKEHNKKDIIFLDLNMPGKSGFDVLKEIRRNDDLKALPVVIFSTSNDVNAIDVSKEMGANLFVTKPKSFANLTRVIEKVLGINWAHYKSPPEDFALNYN